MNFIVKRQEEYIASVEDLAKSLAESDLGVQGNFIAEYFGSLENHVIEALAVKMSINGFHRGDKEIAMLNAAIEYKKYQEGR